MVVLKVALLVLAAVVFIIFVILMLPVDVLLHFDGKNGFNILYRFIFKIYGEESNPNNPLLKGVKKIIGISHLESVNTVKEEISSRGATGTLYETVDIIFALLNRVVWLLKYVKIIKCKIIAVSGGEDAAIDYGRNCAIIYPLVGFIENNMKVNYRKENIDIRCDYSAESSAYDFDIDLRVRIIHIIRALIFIVKKNLETKGII